ncbi:hypothetical protein [Thermomonospora amylolytica]|uniref:hypothetical protein n=1 Tax=Thermomonospora amylolytica TaxID=1411117 RepID=UPI000E6BD135|nr:hypothetical protein [Thermomonospora amylolytica]
MPHTDAQSRSQFHVSARHLDLLAGQRALVDPDVTLARRGLAATVDDVAEVAGVSVRVIEAALSAALASSR